MPRCVFQSGCLLAGLVLAGLLLIGTGSGSEVVTASALLADRDQDGMPDLWEILHELDPDDPSDSPEDPDGDQYNNLSEYLAGTDPQSAESVLQFTKIAQTATNEFLLQFKAVPNRAYTVVVRTSNQTTNWERIRDFPAAPTNRLIELTHTFTDPSEIRLYSVFTMLPQ